MKFEKLLDAVRGADRIPPDLAKQVLGFGITEFLTHGVGYDDAMEIIAKAEISIQREQSQGF